MTNRTLPSARVRITPAVVAVLATTATMLTACSNGPDPEPTATAFANALTTGDFTEVRLADTTADDAATEMAAIVEDMHGLTPTVHVDDIKPLDDDSQNARLTVTWDLDDTDSDWTYTTTATLNPTEDEWEVQWEPATLHPKLTPGARLSIDLEQAPRAEVLGAGGAALMSDRGVFRVGIDKTKVSGAAVTASSTALAEILDVDPARFVDRVASAGPKAFVEAITLRQDDAVGIMLDIGHLDGAVAIEDTLPLALTREFGRPILGTVGEATAEVIQASQGRISTGDMVGLSGLQEQYDAQLRGVAGITVAVVPTKGDPVVVHEREPKPGTAVVTTLDADLQIHAESILADVGPAGAIVAIQPSTGHVLAAASGPGGEGYSTATLGQYAPGSTFKIVTSLALLRAGLTTDSTLDCPETTTVDGKTFKNYSDYPADGTGEISFRQAIANSCNTALINQRDTVSQADIAGSAGSLGLGVDHDLGVPAFLGSIPAEAGRTEHAASMIGQGEVLASPLAMATVAASVARGQTVVPRLIDGTPVSAENTLTAAEAEQLRGLMRAVVEEGSGRFLLDVPGEAVGAKTGTAEYGTEDPPRTHGWMIAIQGDLAVAVMVEDAVSGSHTAGPILEQFLTSE